MPPFHVAEIDELSQAEELRAERRRMAVGANRAISESTHMVCLLGNPTSHSLSPAIHNLSFELLGIDSEYRCFDVENEELATLVAKFRHCERWDGFNVTMPCKQAIVEHLDELDDVAELIGAVNVVSKSVDGYALGHNTDGVGFMASLVEHGVDTKGAHMVLLGPGGAGSAILAQAALDGVAQIDVFARVKGRGFRGAEKLVERLDGRTGCVLTLNDIACERALASSIQAADILVNATPVGMGEGCADTLVPQTLLKPDMVVADAIYHPRETRLLREAAELGCVTVSGLGMLLAQAAASEAIWYGAQMPTHEIASCLFSA